MAVLIDIPLLRKAPLILGIFCTSLALQPAQAQIQAGRTVDGTLLISDQPLPNGVKAAPMELDQLMTLQPATKTPAKPALLDKPQTTTTAPGKQTPEEAATCRSIQKRYNETRKTLENTERDKASGKLLIPDSGLVTMRQNLATLERLLALCQP